MASHRQHISAGSLALAALAFTCMNSAVALAQPTLIVNGLADDMSSDGTKSIGYLFDYSIPAYVPYTWQRGVGYSTVPGTDFGTDALRASNDFSAISTGKSNISNWGNLNCFSGYCAFGDCVPGEPLPPPSPCMIPSIAHRYTTATGWVNTGSVPRLQDAGTGRFFGGTRCDSTINTANDISGNGTVIVGGAWSAPLLDGSGGPGYGLCGDLVAFKYDSTTGTTETLPTQPGTLISRADSVNNDGSVITGYDQGLINDPSFPYEGRRICVWTNGVQTLIDDLSGSYAPYIVNGPGNVIAGGPSPVFCTANFAIEDLQLVKWTRQLDNSWTPAALGRPIDYFDGFQLNALSAIYVNAVSDDGNTIVGTAEYGSPFFGGVARPFIWGPGINGGVPMDFQTYLEQIAPGSPLVQPGFSITRINGISADGNALSVVVRNAINTCIDPAMSLDSFDRGVLYLNGAGIACDAPRIAIGPRDYVSTQYTPFGVSLNVFASGTFPMTYTWEREDTANPGQWLPLTEACAGFGYGAEWDYEGINKNQLRIGQATCGNNRDGRYRVTVSNSCGTVTSDPATVTFQQGTLVLNQPVNAVGCRRNFQSFQAVAVSNSSDLTEQWEIADASNPTSFTQLFDGLNTMSDGRVLDVFGSTGQFLGITPSPLSGGSSYIVRCNFYSPCGDAMSDTATLTFCDADFNCDSIVDFFDYLDFVDAFGAQSGDADFNGDQTIDFFDYLDFVDAFSSGC